MNIDPTKQTTDGDRFDYDDRGNLDDVVVPDVETFRLEYMDKGVVWIRCYRKERPDVVFWLSARGKITGRHEYD
jgi:hypothetical protein